MGRQFNEDALAHQGNSLLGLQEHRVIVRVQGWKNP